MAKKKIKVKPHSTRVPARATKNSEIQENIKQWLWPLLFTLIGACLYYFLNPILVYSPSVSVGYNYGLTFLCAVLAFSCSTKLFTRHSAFISNIAFAILLIQISANLALAYGWVNGNQFIKVIAHSLTIPLAIVWFFLLKNLAFSQEQSEGIYSFREKFGNKYFRILGLLVLIISGALIFYRLGYYDVWEDENLVINAAIGMQEQGLEYLNEGYKRTWLHSWLVSGFFDVFGVSEFNGRLPSALFGLAFVIICFYVFTRWFGIWSLALLVPIVCLMNDRFLILFRYMRMYALLIPVFLFAVYFFYRTLTLENTSSQFKNKMPRWFNRRLLYVVFSLIFLLLLAHLHKLAMVVLPVFFISILIFAIKSKTKHSKYLLFGFTAGCILLAYLALVVRLDSLKMFAQVYDKLFSSFHSFPEYYSYMLENGLPSNSVVMVLIAGSGLFLSGIANGVKQALSFGYLLISIALVSMVYLVEGEGRDYRYVAHIVPFVVAISLYVWYQIGQLILRKYLFGWMLVLLMIASLQLVKDYKRVYVKHPWAPSYSIVYNTLKSRFKPGDALFAHNIKTYYLDPKELAGEHYHKVPNKKQYSLEQFKEAVFAAQRGWIMWDKHKSHHWQDEVLQYIYSHFRLVHGAQKDGYGVDLFYFDEKMIAN